ncbi:MAG: DUF4198 domain-containing protein [Gemmatimonadaceae bacterium]
MHIPLVSARRFGLWLIAAAAALLFVVLPLEAHDFWIVPDAFQVAVGAPLLFRTVTGVHFATSESPVAADLLTDARILAGDSSRDERLGDFSVSGKSLMIGHKPATAGQRVVVLALAPRTSRMTGEAFLRYLRLEGAADAADRLLREGRSPSGSDSVEMRSTKFAKTLAEVGSGGPRAFQRTAGHALEFVPLSDPRALRAGETLSLRVVARGRRLVGARVYAGRAPDADTTSENLVLTTDDAGVVQVPASRAGLWNVRTSSVAASTAVGRTTSEWEVEWATFVFAVAGTRPQAQSANDSADVVGTVSRFHDALARGDSAAALALLAPDVVILESGDVERRGDYRSHHLQADIAFARAIPGSRTLIGVSVAGDAAWVSATSTTVGQFNGHAINSLGAELVVLTRARRQGESESSTSGSAPWQIRAIHWSSRRKTP